MRRLFWRSDSVMHSSWTTVSTPHCSHYGRVSMWA
uniref:Uncharacterized protein n=1 Tax=Parascaris equorum TaxID=6256 RepID=A0A914RRS0_PAREQ